ncbi:hypothetical protein [Spiroplasma endosymbiont of Aspidapion aeneum]|uniref:hypothetical protein n=1 Tax=Spiroplasma endosymbiont of Aspidapion aeneum TaxID=3066276 RepID=UPI00313C797E
MKTKNNINNSPLIWYGIKQTLKLNKGLIIFFNIFWVFIVTFFAGFSLIIGASSQNVTAFGLSYVITPGNRLGSENIIAPSTAVGYLICSTLGLLVFSIFSIAMLNKILFSEIKNNKITIWLSTNLSRYKIFIVKFSSVFIMNVTAAVSELIPLFIILLCCKDVQSIYFFKIIFQELNLLWVVAFVMLLFTLIFFYKESRSLLNSLFSIFIVVVIILYFIRLIAAQYSDNNNSSFNNIGQFAQKIDISNLIVDLFQKNDDQKQLISTDNANKTYIFGLKKVNALHYILLFFSVNGLSSLMFYLNIKIFANRDYNI